MIGSAGNLATTQKVLDDAGADGTATLVLGGQVGSDPEEILLVYPEGN